VGQDAAARDLENAKTLQEAMGERLEKAENDVLLQKHELEKQIEESVLETKKLGELSVRKKDFEDVVNRQREKLF